MGEAAGFTGSAERNSQLNQLWGQDLEYLHLIVSHKPENKERWIEVFLNIPPSQYLFLRVHVDVDYQEYVEEILGHFHKQ